MTANINKYAENISQLQEKIKHAETDIAIWKQHLNKLKAL
jgi:peptidoglycan hydrolase CwlO-like protein